MNGLLIVNKPSGPTSHDIVNKIRKWSGERRVGHTGTLDPLASGVLVLCLGPTTRISEYLTASNKRYEAVVRFGQTTDTYDRQGRVLSTRAVRLTPEEIAFALEKFRGTITQTPPAYSAVQVGGRRAYEMARRGERLDIKPRTTTIHLLAMVSWQPPNLTLDIACSAGTYIRSLANDLGEALGCGAHVTRLTRTAAGRFTLRDSHPLPELEAALRAGRAGRYIRPAGDALTDWPAVNLDPESANRISHGNPVPMADPRLTGLARAYSPSGEMIAIVEADPAAREWKPKKVLITA